MDCAKVCIKRNRGKKITVKLDEKGKNVDKKVEPLIESSVSVSGTNAGGNVSGSEPDTCHYNCQSNGGCTVRIVSSGPVNGNTLGSCFSEIFGGECSGTPEKCSQCLGKCKDKKGQEFSEEVKK